MKLRSLVVVAALVALPATTLAAGAFKQSPPPTQPPAEATVTLDVGGKAIDFDLPSDRNWIAYCTASNSSLGGGSVVTVQEMVRTTDGWRSGPAYQAPATNEWDGCQVGDAHEIDPNVANKGQ